MHIQRFARAVVVSILLLPTYTWAQTLASGSIAGVVRDTTSAVLPGVTVEAASPALIEKVRTAVTDGQGVYRIVDLRPGTYTVTFTLPGFGIIRREGLELTTGFTATVNAELRVGSLEETITVTGASPVVDVQNTRTQTVISSTLLAALPTGRTLQGYAMIIPGAVLPARSQDVGGNRGDMLPGGTFGIHGVSSGEQRQLEDGMRFNNSSGGAGRAWAVNYAAVQETAIELGGISAEGEVGGVQVNAVPKDGGNSFAGTFTITATNHNFQSNNLNDELRARRLTTQSAVKTIYDVNGGVGGPIKQDKLWFFTAHAKRGATATLPGNYFNKTQGTLFYTPDLSRPAYTDINNRDNRIRLTWQAAPKHKLAVTYANQDICSCFFNLQNVNSAPEAVTNNHYRGPNYMLQSTWSYPATNRLLFEAGGTYLRTHWDILRQPGVTADTIGILELSNNYRYGSAASGLSAASSYSINDFYQTNQRFAVSYITGSHAFKTGLFAMETAQEHTSTINRDQSYTFLNGIPRSVTLWASPIRAGERTVLNLGLYTQDQWTIRKLTLNLGVRFDYLNSIVPEQHVPAGQFIPARDFAQVADVPNWKNVSPRLGGAYDLRGDGKTALKVSLGRYVNGEGTSLASAANPVRATVLNATRVWNDVNRDYIPQETELGPLSNAAFGTVRRNTRHADEVLVGWERGYNWQGSASIQHELRPGFAVNVGYFRTWFRNFLTTDNQAVTAGDFTTYCITAPVDSRLPGGGGNQICGLYDINSNRFGQVNSLITFAKNYGEQTDVFNGVDVTINAQFGQGGSVSGGMSTGRQVTDHCDVSVGNPQLLTTGQVATSPRTTAFCHTSPPWSAGTQAKFNAVYPLPWDFQTSVTFQNLSGIPILASYVATNAQVAPSLGRNLSGGANATATIDLIPPGTAYEDRITQLDFRLTRILRIGRTSVLGMFDVYNVFNASPILATNSRFGPSWLVPQEILGGRLVKFGAQLNF